MEAYRVMLQVLEWQLYQVHDSHLGSLHSFTHEITKGSNPVRKTLALELGNMRSNYKGI
jgi:hypothetical protein